MTVLHARLTIHITGFCVGSAVKFARLKPPRFHLTLFILKIRQNFTVSILFSLSLECKNTHFTLKYGLFHLNFANKMNFVSFHIVDVFLSKASFIYFCSHRYCFNIISVKIFFWNRLNEKKKKYSMLVRIIKYTATIQI